MDYFLFAVVALVVGVFEIFRAASRNFSQDVVSHTGLGLIALTIIFPLTLWCWRKVRRTRREAKRRSEAIAPRYPSGVLFRQPDTAWLHEEKPGRGEFPG